MLTSNSKLKKDKILAFNLPPIKTCPGAGACKEYCYATKGFYRVFKKNMDKTWLKNLQLSKSAKFIKVMIEEIKNHNKYKTIRIHAEGDFYNQKYLNKWISIIKACPEVKFYCYTKSLHLNWKQYDLLPNVYRVQSMGGKFDSKINYSRPHVKVFNTKLPMTHINASYSDKVIMGKGIKFGLIKH